LSEAGLHVSGGKRKWPLATSRTAVHFTLIFFVMVSLIAGVMAYMNFSQNNEFSTQIATLKSEKDNLNGTNRKYLRRDRGAQEARRARFPERRRPRLADQTTVIARLRPTWRRTPARSPPTRSSAGSRSCGRQSIRPRRNANQLQAEVKTDLKAKMLASNAQYQVAERHVSRKQATDADPACGRPSRRRKRRSPRGQTDRPASDRPQRPRHRIPRIQDRAEKIIADCRTTRSGWIAINNKISDKLTNHEGQLDKPTASCGGSITPASSYG